ncbi:hypothetical protein Tco_1167294 [Tanacetum coccineum]
MQLSVEQAFWLPLSNPKSEQLDIIQTPVDIEVPKELPKISLVKTSFQKLKNHLASFDKVVKVRTTLDAITEGSWGFEHTKKVFKEKVIPFINRLRVSFRDFENSLYSELNEVKTVFNQMEAAVDQYVMKIVMHANSISVNVLHADNKYIVQICVNSLASHNDCREMQHFIDEYNENLMLKAELAKKGQMVEKTIFDEVNNPNVIAPGMFKLDLVPLAPKLLNNRDAHIDYIRHSREHVDTLREIVEHARALRPLDSDLDYACKIVQRIHEVLVYVKDTCPSLTKPTKKFVVVTPLNKKKLGNTKNNRILQTTSSNKKNKVEDHSRSVKSKSNKMNRIIEHVCNANVKHTMLNANFELIYVKCKECMFDANYDVCFLEFVNDVNVRSKSKSAKKSKNKNIWKPTGKVFTDIGYRWKPTGRTFTIAGNTCPLTRIISTKVVPLKETTSKSVTTQNP